MSVFLKGVQVVLVEIVSLHLCYDPAEIVRNQR